MGVLQKGDYLTLAVLASLQEGERTQTQPDLTDIGLTERVRDLLSHEGHSTEGWQWEPTGSGGWYFGEVDAFTSRLVSTNHAVMNGHNVELNEAGRAMCMRILKRSFMDPAKERELAVLADSIGFDRNKLE